MDQHYKIKIYSEKHVYVQNISLIYISMSLFCARSCVLLLCVKILQGDGIILVLWQDKEGYTKAYPEPPETIQGLIITALTSG